MLLIDTCNFTLFSFEWMKDKGCIDCYSPANNKNNHNIIYKRKYKYIIIGLECLTHLSLRVELHRYMKNNRNAIIILISSTNWPMKNNFFKLKDCVYITGRIDLLTILERFLRNDLEDYLSHKPILHFSTQEKDVLHMMMNQEEKLKICNILSIKTKTISSHISNIKRKASATSYQQLNLAFRAKYVYFTNSSI